MSVEATALSRSRLEQKDRAELAAIVEAMGGKAGSRAKKADLVEQVLQLAGEGNNGKVDKPESEAVVEPAPLPTTSDDEPPADWEVAVATEAPAETAPHESAEAESPVTPRPEQPHESSERASGEPRDGAYQGQ